jgi:hypothetical protein
MYLTFCYIAIWQYIVTLLPNVKEIFNRISTTEIKVLQAQVDSFWDKQRFITFLQENDLVSFCVVGRKRSNKIGVGKLYKWERPRILAFFMYLSCFLLANRPASINR